jgi:hypothetical protein
MASGHVNRIKRPNTWLRRPMLQNVKKLLPTRSRPHMALFRHGSGIERSPLLEAQQKTSALSEHFCSLTLIGPLHHLSQVAPQYVGDAKETWF